MKTPVALNREQVERLAAAERVENERAAFWPLIPVHVREIAMMSIRLPRARANDPLTAFSANERHSIMLSLTALELQLTMVKRCMADTTSQTTVLPGHLH